MPRFSIRSILVFVVFAAIAVSCAVWVVELQNSRPIETAIAEFDRYHEQYNLEIQDPLTVNEVVESVNNFVSKATLPPAVDTAFRKILRTKRVSNDIHFNVVQGIKEKRKVIWITVTMPENETIYPIRETDDGPWTEGSFIRPLSRLDLPISND